MTYGIDAGVELRPRQGAAVALNVINKIERERSAAPMRIIITDEKRVPA